MRYLILVKHAMPEIVPDVPAREWRLSDDGRRQSQVLAGRLAAYAPEIVVTSNEPKAAETGAIVATALGRPTRFKTGLHEHDRTNVPFGSADRFAADVRRFFAQPDRLVHGRETADDAHRRFAAAIDEVLRAYPTENVAVVAHGTVIALFVARATGSDGYELWERLELPAYVVLELPGLAVAEVVAGL
jgi:broad specificity phosphatase PhoE